MTIATDIPTVAQASNTLLVSAILIVAVFAVMMGIVTYMVLLERKVAAWVQDRIGPNRAGPLGIIQPLADAIKMFFKEEFTPARADRWLYLLAPIWIIIPALIGIAVVPLAGTVEIGGRMIDLQIAQVDVGILYILAVSGLGVYGVVLGGWASNSKYSFFGGLRATAQMISYEIPLALSVLSIVIISGGTLRLEEIVGRQAGLWLGWLPKWNIFLQPYTALILFTCFLAETNRLPFDLPEAEQELVGGYHTEYSSMKFGFFMLSEYAHILVGSTVFVILFFGGWHFWGLSADQTAWHWALLKVAVLLGKVFLVIFFIMQIRWTLPRFRFDQVMRLAWKGWLPAVLAILLTNILLVYFAMPLWTYTLGNIGVFLLTVMIASLNAGPITGRQKTLAEVTAEN
jgi:NADH-quinone oxidoreductase subunit H